jgi:hypothetical protein
LSSPARKRFGEISRFRPDKELALVAVVKSSRLSAYQERPQLYYPAPEDVNDWAVEIEDIVALLDQPGS